MYDGFTFLSRFKYAEKKERNLTPKAKGAGKKTQLLELADGFCQRYLDSDYQELCQKMILKLSRKRTVPFLSGRIEIWAASIIQALGQVNFLFDKSFEPFVSVATLNKYFGTTQSTVTNKARELRRILKMDYFNTEFATQRMLRENPLHNLVMVNGFMLTADRLPPELQKIIHETGIREFELIQIDEEH